MGLVPVAGADMDGEFRGSGCDLHWERELVLGT